MTDDELRRALGAPPPAHVSEDDWVAWASGELSAEAASRLLAHVATCRECARVRQVVREVEQGARPSTTRWWAGGAAVLALAAAALIAVAVRSPEPGPGPDVLRGGGWGAEVRVDGGLQVIVEAHPGADAYRLTVRHPDGTVAHRETGPGPVFVWAGPPGRWSLQVEALALGQVLAVTHLQAQTP